MKVLQLAFPTWIKKIIARNFDTTWQNSQFYFDYLVKTPIKTQDAIMVIDKRWPHVTEEKVTDTPIFILSAGWRSGSTWVQRMVMQSPQVIIWGEPYAHCSVVQNMAEQIKPFTNEEWPLKNSFIGDKKIENLHKKWIANLYPEFEYLKTTHRSFLTNLFAVTALEKGATRWGIKEVRLTVDHAFYLRWLFPMSKFIFLIRNPYDAYRSYKGLGKFYYDRWPDVKINTPEKFGTIWKMLAEGFVRDYAQVDGTLLKYEDLLDGKVNLSKLSDYLELDLQDPNTLEKINRWASYSPPNLTKVTKVELEALSRVVEPLARELGYSSTS
jgi:hypothetical protein